MSKDVRRRLKLVLLVVLMGMVALTALYGYRRHRAKLYYATLRAQAFTAATAGAHERVVQNLEPYLPRHAEDAEALAIYVRSRPLVPAAQHAEISYTVYGLRQLLRLEPGRVVERRQLLGLYTQIGHAAEALDTAELLLSRYGDRHPQTWRGKTIALARLRKYGDALKACDEWVKVASSDLEAQLLAVQLRSSERRPAQEIRDCAARAFPDDKSRAQLVQGCALLLTAHDVSDREAAGQLLAAAAAAGPDDDRAFGDALVRQLDAAGQSDLALNALSRMYKRMGGDDLRYNLACRLWEAGEVAQVVDLFPMTDVVDAEMPSDLLAIRAIALQAIGRADDAKRVVERLAARRGDAVAAAWAMVVGGPESRAKPDASRLIAACQQAVENSPADRYLRYFIGEAYARIGEIELALRIWHEAARANPSWAMPHVRTAQILLSIGRWEHAYQSAEAGLIRAKRHPAAQLIYVQSWARCLEAGLLAGTEEQLLASVASTAAATPPGPSSTTGPATAPAPAPNLEAVLVRATVLARMGRKAEARGALDLVLSSESAPNESMLLRCADLSRRYELQLEEACFNRSMREHGVTADLAYAMAARLEAIGERQKGLDAFSNAMAGAGADRETGAWQLNWSKYLELIGDARAKDAMIKLADDRAGEIAIQKMAVTAASVRGDYEFRSRAVDRLRKLSGEQSLGWRVARARMLLDQEELFPGNAPDQIARRESLRREALALLPDVVARAPNWVEPRALMGNALARDKRLPEAIEQFRLARDVSPASAALGLALARLYQENGEHQKAKEELAHVATIGQVGAQQRRQMAELLFAQGESSQAIELLKDATGQNDADNDLILADLYRQQHDLDKAGDHVKKALERAPDARAIVLTAQLQAQQGRLKEAEQTLERLNGVELPPGRRELTKADFLARHNQLGRAIEILGPASAKVGTDWALWQALIGYQLVDGRADDAVSSLQKAMLALPDDQAIQVIAKQQDLLNLSRSPALRGLTVALLNPLNNAAAAEALRAAGQERNDGSPATLNRSLQQIADAHPRVLPLQLLLAQRYLEVDEVDAALAAAGRAADIAPGLPEPYRLLVEATAKADRWTECVAFARKWRERAFEQAAEADAAIATALLRLDRVGEALEVLKPYRGDPSSRDYAAMAELIARAEAAAGREASAKVFEPLLQQGLQGRISWMSEALRRPSHEEGAAWLRRVVEVVPADAMTERVALSEAWGTLATLSGDANYTREARAILEPLAARPDASAVVVLAMATRLERDGDLTGAEAFYRRVLTIEPSLIAQNNLAMLLAGRGGDLAEAERLIDASIVRSQNVAPLHDTKAVVLEKGKQYRRAIESMYTAVRLEPSNIEYRIHLAELLLKAGERNKAHATLAEMEKMRSALRTLREDVRKRLDVLRSALADSTAAAPGNG